MATTDQQPAPASTRAEEVREEAGAWLDANWDPDLTLGEWWARLAESGWAFPTWPSAWFGRDLPSNLASVVSEERRRVGAAGPPSGIGVMMAGPTIVTHGTDEQRRRFIPAMVRGEEVWCQLFSEPGSGSDLASLQTRAVRDGDEWVVNGQKVWTSGAQFSRWGILIARTNVDLPKHKGITFFVIDMEGQGVEVRPLKEMSGGATFNEVFLTDARVPHENVIGDVDEGWAVAVTTLAHERNSLGAGGMAGMMGGAGGGEIIGKPDLSRRAGDVAGSSGGFAGMGAGAGGLGGGSVAQMLGMLATVHGRGKDLVTRQQVAQLYTLVEIARFTSLRAQAAVARGGRPGPEVSTGKLAMSQIVRLMRDTSLGILGAGGMLSGEDAPMAGMMQYLALMSPALSIAGGTDEVQKNIVGERVLGLPSEPRVDKDIAFRDLKVGTQTSA